MWPVITEGKMTLHTAVVSSIDKDDVFGVYESAFGIAAGTFSIKMNVAASFFVPINLAAWTSRRSTRRNGAA